MRNCAGILTVVAMALTGCQSRHFQLAQTATPLWTADLGESSIYGLTPNEERLLVRVGYQRLVAFDASNGLRLWDRTYPIAGRFRRNGKLLDAYETEEVLVAGNRGYFMGFDESVHVLDLRTGEEVGSSAPVFSLLGATQNAVYVLNAERHLDLLRRDGRPYLETRINGDETTRLRIAAGKIFLSSAPGGPPLQVFDSNAHLLWTSTLKAAADAFIDSQKLYLTSGEDRNEIAALDLSQGKPIWRHRLKRRPSGLPATILTDGQGEQSRLYVLSAAGSDQSIVTLDRATGEQLSQLKLPGDTGMLPQIPFVDGRTLYVIRSRLHGFFQSFDSGTADNLIAAIDLDSGKEIWRTPWRFEKLSTPIASRDMVFVSARGEDRNPFKIYGFRAAGVRNPQ